MAQDFIEARRSSQGLLTSAERRMLIWLAGRMPARVNSDHLTTIGFVSLGLTGLSFALSNGRPAALPAAVFFLAVNWFGDSLDGTLARVRGHQRPRYGFYLDHILDTFGAAFVLAGLAVSGHMSPLVAVTFLAAYYILSIEIYLATYCIGRFQMSFWGLGPTELRILLSAGALMLIWKPAVTIAGIHMPLFDVGAIVGTLGLVATAIISAVRNTRMLYRAEPLPADGRQRDSGAGAKPEARSPGPNRFSECPSGRSDS